MKTTQDLHGQTLVECASVFTRSRFNGGTLTRTFKGTYDEIVAKENELILLNYTTKRTQGPLYVLEATISNVDDAGNPTSTEYSDADGTSTSWELQPQTAQIDLLGALHVPLIRNLPGLYIKYIKEKLDDPENKERILVPMPNTSMTSDNHAAAQLVWQLLLNGTTTVDVNFPVIKQVINCPIDYGLVGFSKNEGRLLSKFYLVSNENVPYNYAYIMPEYVYPDTSMYVTKDGLYYAYSYKQSPTIVQQISATQNQITREWTFGLWNQNIYNNPLV